MLYVRLTASLRSSACDFLLYDIPRKNDLYKYAIIQRFSTLDNVTSQAGKAPFKAEHFDGTNLSHVGQQPYEIQHGGRAHLALQRVLEMVGPYRVALCSPTLRFFLFAHLTPKTVQRLAVDGVQACIRCYIKHGRFITPEIPWSCASVKQRFYRK